MQHLNTKTGGLTLFRVAKQEDCEVWRLQGGREDDYKAGSVAQHRTLNKRQLRDAAEMRADMVELVVVVLVVLN